MKLTEKIQLRIKASISIAEVDEERMFSRELKCQFGQTAPLEYLA